MHSELRIGYKLYILALLFASLAIFCQVLPLNTSEYFQQHLGLSSSNVVNLTSLYFITYAMMQIPGGILFDKYGLKYVLPLSIAIATVGCSLYFTSSNGFMLGFSRLITGVGCSVAYIAGIYIAIKFLPSKLLPLLIGVLEAGSTSGSIIGVTPLRYSLNAFGWSFTGYIIIGFCLLLLLSSLILVQKLKNHHKTEVSINAAVKSAFCLLKNKVLLAVFIYSFTTWLVIMSFAGYWLKNYLINVHDYSELQSLHLIQVYWASFMIASVVISLMIKDFESAKIMVCVLSGIGFITYLIMALPWVFNYHSVLLVVIFGGISAGGVIVAFAILPQIAPPHLSGSVVSMNNTFIVLGGFAGQVIFGYVLEHINIADIVVNYDFGNLEPHYYTALLIYPLFTLIAFMSIVYAMLGVGQKNDITTYSHHSTSYQY
jgi:MFS family permease